VPVPPRLEREGAAHGGGAVPPGALRPGVTALSYFYFSNAATLATAFGHDLLSPAAKAARRHAVEVVLGYLLGYTLPHGQY
jgi:hypothetical protein